MSHCCLSVEDCIVIPASNLYADQQLSLYFGAQSSTGWTVAWSFVHCEHCALSMLCMVDTLYCGDLVHAVHEHTLLLRGGTDSQPAYLLSRRNNYVFCHDVCHLFALVCCGQDADIHVVAIMPV